MLVCAAATLFQFSARGANIAVSGFNDDVVTEASPTRFGRQFDSTTFFPADWVETFTRVGTVPGLPSSHVFTSATGSGVVYHLQSYTANNVLHMGGGDPTSEAMTVISGQYSALHILAASGTDGTTALDVLGHTSDITLNFTDGSVTLPGALLAYDWNINNSKAPSNIVAIGPICINVLVDGASTPPAASSLLDTGTYGTGYGLYETTLNLSDLGLSARTLNSITFNDVNATHSTTGVFAVDGIAAPEPSAIALMMVAATGLLGRRRTSRLEQ
ncbi:MAG: hypothetical protein JWO87_3371 [Phycisphaerales bacterium]|nr:hypothetical protein [Phycisphaerales bacterium]